MVHDQIQSIQRTNQQMTSHINDTRTQNVDVQANREPENTPMEAGPQSVATFLTSPENIRLRKIEVRKKKDFHRTLNGRLDLRQAQMKTTKIMKFNLRMLTRSNV